MALTVDLFNSEASGKEKGCVWARDAAVFKDILKTPRVLADSQFYLAYTMKKANVLRVVQRSNALRGSLHCHTKPISAVSFVNYRSNVAASAGKGEFFVWVVTDKTEDGARSIGDEARLVLRLYFKLQDPVTIPCFSFYINAENQRPDLLILYDTYASILEGSSLIQRFESDPLEATLQRNSKMLRALNREVGEDSFCAVGSGGWFAFTTEPTMVAACTLQNCNTPSWACCDGEKVMSLQLLDTPWEESTAVLLAASTCTIYQWILTGVAEPSLLRKFVVNGGSIVLMESSRETFAVFDDKKRLALVSVQSPHDFECTFFDMPAQVQRGGVCFNRAGEGSCILADLSDRLSFFQLGSRINVGSDESHQRERQQGSILTKKPLVSHAGVNDFTKSGIAAAASFANKEREKKKEENTSLGAKATYTRIDKNVIANLVNQLGSNASLMTLVNSRTSKTTTEAPGVAATVSSQQFGNSFVHTNCPVTAGLTAATTDVDAAATLSGAADVLGVVRPSPAAVHGARPALHNASLPQAPSDGLLNAAVSQSDDEVRQALQRLESVMANTSQIMQLVPETIRRDHEQLLNLSLEAQITELQRSISVPQAPQQSTGSVKFPPFETSILMSIMNLLACNVTSGATRGVKEAMLSHFDHEMRRALENSLGPAIKQSVKKCISDALRETTNILLTQLTQMVENKVKRELTEVLGGIDSAFKTLLKENAALQKALNDIASSDVIKEMRTMREEIKNLRGTVRNQESTLLSSTLYSTGTLDSRQKLLPETILVTAMSVMQERHYRQGLEYLLMAKQPRIIIQFFTTLMRENNETYLDLVEDTKIPNDVWCDVLLQLVEAVTAEGEREMVVNVAVDILSEHEQLLQKSAIGAKLASSLLALGQQARTGTTSVSFLHCLKSLEKLLQ